MPCFLGGAWDPQGNTSHAIAKSRRNFEDFPGHLLSPDPPDAAKVATWLQGLVSLKLQPCRRTSYKLCNYI